MANFWKLVNDVIEKSDILLLVLDARFPDETRNEEIEVKIENLGKKLIYVINKCDLISEHEVKAIKKRIKPSVFVSSKNREGSTVLFKKIMSVSHGESCTVGVLGYPNVGKSSVINLLKGKKSARTSSYSGFTTGLQQITARKKLKLIDTPGVLAFQETDFFKQIMIGSVNPHKLNNPEAQIMLLIEKFPAIFERVYNVRFKDNSDEILEEIAEKANVVKRGGIPDTKRMAIILLQDWQKGKLHEESAKDI